MSVLPITRKQRCSKLLPTYVTVTLISKSYEQVFCCLANWLRNACSGLIVNDFSLTTAVSFTRMNSDIWCIYKMWCINLCGLT